MSGKLSNRGKARAKALVRRLLRHSSRIDTTGGTAPWTASIVGMARSVEAGGASKAEVRASMTAAADVAAVFDAVREQHRLLERYHGGDVDSTDYRAKAAARVGLSVPAGVPLQARDLGAKYSIDGILKRAEGIEGMKQELYGTRSRSGAKRGASDPDDMRP